MTIVREVAAQGEKAEDEVKAQRWTATVMVGATRHHPAVTYTQTVDVPETYQGIKQACAEIVAIKRMRNLYPGDDVRCTQSRFVGYVDVPDSDSTELVR